MQHSDDRADTKTACLFEEDGTSMRALAWKARSLVVADAMSFDIASVGRLLTSTSVQRPPARRGNK